MKKNTALILLSYLTLYIVWGSTYLAIRIAVGTMPAFYVVGLRYFIAGAGFLLLSAASGRLKRLPSAKEFRAAAVLGFFLLILGNGLVTMGEKTVDSYIAAIIISSTPFCVAFFNRLIYKEKLHFTRLIGIIIGMAGVGIVLWKGDGGGIQLSAGIGLIMAGFLAWSFATSYARSLPVHPDSMVNTGIEMSLAGIFALAGAALYYGPPKLALADVSPESWLAVAYLAIVGGGAFLAYNYLLANEPSIRIVSYAIVNPLIAVFLGILILGEEPVPLLWLGVPVILLGLVLMLYGDKIIKPRKLAAGA
jgi:drug/metabolite transporter (DMT)-like permease